MQNTKTHAARADQKRTECPVVIKRYRNRRLFNTTTCRYVTLDHLARMAKAGELFEVYDGPTNKNVTGAILTRIVFEEEGKGQCLLPIGFLRHLIGLYGAGVQALVPGYLDMSMECLARNQERLKSNVNDVFVRSMFERNMQLFAAMVRPDAREGEAA